MFFAHPVGAFTNLRKALKPGGRIDLAVWAPPQDNPWLSAVVALARRHIELPASIPGAPGPFAFDDPDYLHRILTEAGFHDVKWVCNAGQIPVAGQGNTPAGALTFARNALSTGRVLLDYPESVQQAVNTELLELYAHHYQPGEGVMMGYCAWLVSAVA